MNSKLNSAIGLARKAGRRKASDLVTANLFRAGGGDPLVRVAPASAMQAAGFEWNADDAHSAVYDAEQTAKLFCRIANAWPSPLPG